MIKTEPTVVLLCNYSVNFFILIAIIIIKLFPTLHSSFITGLAGKTDIEKAQADMIVDCLDDIHKQTMPFFRDTTEKVNLHSDLVRFRPTVCFIHDAFV